MHRHLVATIICIPLAMSVLAQKNQGYLQYIEQYKDIAILEMHRRGIPASIKLAQALLESEGGRSDLARYANNHFGIKCNPEWDGKTFYKKDDDYDSKGRLIESCFRVYANAEASFVAHSEFLHDPKKEDRYGFLFKLDPLDYRRWAQGLRSAGYATATNYATRLISLIERYELHQYDRASAENPEIVAQYVGHIFHKRLEPVPHIARKKFTEVYRLPDYKQPLDTRTGTKHRHRGSEQVISTDKAYRGDQVWHYVKPGERMRHIAAHYAIHLETLYQRNRMTKGDEPMPNERIKLRGSRVTQPPLLYPQGQPGTTVAIYTPPTTPTHETPYVPVPITTPATPVFAVPLSPETPNNILNMDTTKPQSNPIGAAPNQDRFDRDILEDAPATKALYHTVDKGDTLWNISRRYQCTVDDIKTLNNLTNDAIQIGMKLRVK